MLLAFVLLLPALCGTVAFADEPADSGRRIAVVYDDSGSMMNMEGNWYRAKYAMEVFAAMLTANDEMDIFCMSEFAYLNSGSQPVHVSGSMDPQQRVDIVHNMNSDPGGTPFASVENACSFLAQAPSDKEKWLVVLTDGSFGSGPSSVGDWLIQRSEELDLSVVYLAIGSSAETIVDLPEDDVYAYVAPDARGILSGVTQMANQVFDQRQLPDTYIQAGVGKLNLSLDVSASQIILFAQGKRVEAGTLSGAGGSWDPNSCTNVKYSELMPIGYENMLVTFDQSLQGVLATYTPMGGIPAGDYEVPMSDTGNVQVYYTPNVRAALMLTDRFGNTYDLDGDIGSLYSGDYQISVQLLDGITGKPVNSELATLRNANAVVVNNGNSTEILDLQDGNGTFHLDVGDVAGDISAYLLDGQKVQGRFSATVEQAPFDAVLSCTLPAAVDANGNHFSLKTMDTDPQTLTVEVCWLDPETSQLNLLSQEAWQSGQLTVETLGRSENYGGFWEKLLYRLYDLLCTPRDKDIQWTVELGATLGTYLIRPVWNGDMEHTLWGTFDLKLGYLSEDASATYQGQGACAASVAPLPLMDILPGLIFPYGIGLLLLLIALTLWLRKKRLPRGMVASLTYTGNAGKTGFANSVVTRSLKIQRHFSLFTAEKATITLSSNGILQAGKLEIRATERTLNNSERRFHVLSWKPLQDINANLNGGPLPVDPVAEATGKGKKGRKKKKERPLKPNLQIRCKSNADGNFTNPGSVVITITREKKKRGGRKKKGGRSRRK